MAKTIQKAQDLQSYIGPSKPTLTAEVHASNEDSNAIKVSSRPTFGLDDLDMTEVNQPTRSDDFMMVFDEEYSSSSQHSTSKPKEKNKKKKMAVTRKKFLSLQEKVDKILAAVTMSQQTNIVGPQSIAEQIERLETRQRLAAERISLKVEMGIRALDNNRTTKHKKFITIVERLIQEVSAIKT